MGPTFLSFPNVPIGNPDTRNPDTFFSYIDWQILHHTREDAMATCQSATLVLSQSFNASHILPPQYYLPFRRKL
jgi:hypothetical protein